MSSSRPRLTAGFCLARSSSWKKRTPPIRSLKKRTSMLYCVQTRLSSLGRFCTMSSAVAARAYFADFDLVARARRPARASALELLNGLRDLIHQLAGARARERRAQPAEQEQERRGGARQRARGHRDEVDRNVRARRAPASSAAARPGRRKAAAARPERSSNRPRPRVRPAAVRGWGARGGDIGRR